MSEPLDPAQDPDYAAALDRFLDGLLDDPVADGSVDAQVRADADAITRALGLIGGTLAAEGGGVTAAAGAVPPVAAAACGATVVQLSSWRSKLNPRVLAAAASLVVVLGVGIPLSMSATSGSDSDDAATAIGAPESALDAAAAAPPAPEAKTMAGDDTFGATADTAAGAAAVPGATATDTGTAAAPGSGGQAADAQALEDARNSAPAAGTAAGKSGGTTANAAFADAVACARAIFVGNITSVQPSPDGAHFKVTFLVTEWIAPATGPVSVTYEVYGSTVNSPGADETTFAGQRRLFVVPASLDERMYAYREPEWKATKKQIKAVRDERAGQGC